ncbi:MAG: RNA polymerase sigma factor, partial [Chthoniobacterales bacterium]
MRGDEDDIIVFVRAREGSEEAFEILFQRYFEAVYAFVYRVSLDVGAAEDSAQETFIKAARSLRRFRGDAAFRSWLFQIAMNTTRDWQRRVIRERLVLEEVGERVQEGDRQRSADFGNVREALAALKDDFRYAIALVYFEGFSHAESARILNCSESTVSWRIFRAKRQLKRWF